MTPGTILFASGLILIGAGILLLIITAALMPGQKKRISARMKEKY